MLSRTHRGALRAALAFLLALPMVGIAPDGVAHAAGSVQLTAFGSAYSQDFDTLANAATPAPSSTPVGWEFAEAGSNANLFYGVGTGSGNAGDTYSFGAAGSTERAFGGLLSGSVNPTIGGSFTNATGGVITTLDIAYTGEQWRLGTLARVDRLDVEYSTNATSVATGTWTAVDALDFVAPVTTGTIGLLNGNVAPNRSVISATISGLFIAPDETVWLRWTDFNATGADDGLAVDNISVTPFGIAVDAAPTVDSTTPGASATEVAVTSSIVVVFSESVTLDPAWFTLDCGGVLAATVSGAGDTYTIDPDTNLPASALCTLTITAAAVFDVDSDDPPSTMAADYTTSFTVIGPDVAPAVSSTVPTDGATGVPLNQTLTVNFSEPVTVGDPWHLLDCVTSGIHATTVTGGPVSFVLDPTTDFVFGEACSLTIIAGAVVDQDSNDPPDAMTIDFVVGFSVVADPCSLPFTPAYQIQGAGPAAAVIGVTTTQGVVVADYEYPGTGSTAQNVRGFYLQDLNGDADPATSDALFVFNGNNNSVSLGDIVRVTGTAGEFQDQTQLGSVTALRLCGIGSIAPTPVSLPFADVSDAERFEGMLVTVPQTLYVTEHFQLGRFGQVLLSGSARLSQPTNVVTPGAAANALQAMNNLNKILLDDASQLQNPDPILFGRGGQPLSASNTLRGGDTISGLTGVMTYTWAGNAASGNAFRLRPINALGASVPDFQPANPRPTAVPAVGGTVRVAGMNLLNFFNTFDGLPDPTGNDNCDFGVGGAPADCRGADTLIEFNRQWPKTVAAIVGTDAHVIGINEIENDGYGIDSAIQFLVDQLNAATAPGTYAFVDADGSTGLVNALGTDAIKVGMLYKPAVVTPVGQTGALNSVDFVNGGDSAPRSRPALAQAFEVNDTGARFTAVINHLKSKGSACDAPDTGDGQGNCNAVRVNAAQALVDWLGTDPTGTGDPDTLIIGDLNSYAKEDPITLLQTAGFTNLIEAFNGPLAYSYVFDGQWGYLDHALSSASMTPQVNDVKDWHVNADEPGVLDYNTDFKTANLVASLYAPDEFRISDHDIVLIGLTPNAEPTVSAGPFSVAEGATLVLDAFAADPNGDTLTYSWDLDGDSVYETAGATPTFSAVGIDGPATRPVGVRVTDPLGLSAQAIATVTITNAAPSVTASFNAPTGVVCGADNATLQVNISDGGSADTQTVTVDWGDGSSLQTVTGAASVMSLAHTYAFAGQYTATVTTTDDDGASTQTTATVAVNYAMVIQAPLAVITVFRAGSAIPVKVRIIDCDGSMPTGLVPTISVTSAAVGANTVTGTMLRIPGENEYVFELATRQLRPRTGTFNATITVPTTGQTFAVDFTLR